MQRYTGSCHCGKVRFEITAEITELTSCDCSLCRKKNALMAKAHHTDFKLLDGEDQLGLYQWNTGTAKHYFCKTCGIYPFHRKRSDPDYYGINVFCLDGVDIAKIPIRAADGKSMSLED